MSAIGLFIFSPLSLPNIDYFIVSSMQSLFKILLMIVTSLRWLKHVTFDNIYKTSMDVASISMKIKMLSVK